MSWFDEQLRFREEADNENFSAAIDSIAGAVMGSRLTKALSDRELAASAMEEILKYFRLRPTREEAPSAELSAEEQLEERMQPHGIEFRAVTLEGDWYRHAVGPMLGTLREDGAAVALIPGRLSGYSYLDLRTGRRVRLNRRTAKNIDPEASCFYQSLPRRAIGIRDLLRFMVGQLSAADIGLYFLLMALAALLGLLSPLFTKWLFGSVLESGSGRVLLALAVFMVCYSLCRILFTTYQGLVNSRVGVKMDVAVEAAVMSRLMHLPAAFFRGYAAGELSQRASNVQSLCKMMFSTLGITGMTSVFSLVYLGQIFAFAPAMVAPALGITLCTVAVSLITTFIQRGISRELMEQAGKNSGLTYATITGIRKIKLAGAEKRMFARWARAYAEELRLQYNSPAFLKLRGAITLAISLGGSLLLYYAAIRNRVGVADYYAFNAAYGMVSGAFASIASVATTLADIRPTLDMARPILEAEPEASEGLERVTKLRGGIELSHVCFRYDESMPYVIDDLSLKIRPGEYVAVVGSTGCGKSTLMRLLLGFEKPQKGSIFFDRYEVSRVEPESLRRRIGAVMQDGKLFPGDIYSNIVITAPRLTLDEAWQAAEIAAIAEDIQGMPMGMHTVISEGQGGISGGQRQRLLIARAVAPKPSILLFDEATSALDNVTQKKVSEAIDGLKCTRVVIAHRLSTIRHADRILYLEGGRIAEEGTYEELIALNGRFAALVSRQRLDIDAE